LNWNNYLSLNNCNYQTLIRSNAHIFQQSVTMRQFKGVTLLMPVSRLVEWRWHSASFSHIVWKHLMHSFNYGDLRRQYQVCPLHRFTFMQWLHNILFVCLTH